MTRPTDWSALGLSSDPTPGDQAQVQDVYDLLHTLATDYQTILDTINTVNGYADSGNLTGATADALRQQMNGRITNFVKSAQQAFSQAAPAINTYLTALTQHQATADGLLTKAQNSGLKPTDDTVKGWATQAKQAGTDLQTASDAAVKVIHNLPGPSDPLSPWEEFLKILGWIALLLILPAMIFGGVIALVEFVVNAILFVNALIEFAQGNLSVGGLLLAALGIIAPTTRALSLGDIVDVIKGIGSFVKT
ncbi:MAG: putative T7SS-secreted protein, partial [Catenulispora sp.]